MIIIGFFLLKRFLLVVFLLNDVILVKWFMYNFFILIVEVIFSWV